MVKLKWGVVSLHCFFLVIMLFGSLRTTKEKQKHIVVNTIRVMPQVKQVERKEKSTIASSPPKNTPVAKAKTPEKTASAQPKVAPPSPKKATATKPKVATPSPKKTTQAPPVDSVKENLLKELQEGIAKMETHKEAFKSAPTSSKIAPLALQIDGIGSFVSGEEGDYVSSLLSYLQETLQLPELGAVKIELTLHQDGSVAKLIVLQAQSKRNKAYLEGRLVQLRFPPLKESESQTFTLNFCNER